MLLRLAGRATKATRSPLKMPRPACRWLCDAPKRVTVVFVEDGEEIAVEADIGKTILEAAHENDVDLEGTRSFRRNSCRSHVFTIRDHAHIAGACDGSLACSTCHVIMEQDHYDALPPPDDEEEDMLDLAFGLTDTSRLGCQIKLERSHDGMVLKIPGS